MWLALFMSTATAAPYAMLQPARTLTSEETEMGGAVYYQSLQGLGDGVAFSGWGRYGLTDRLEVSGGTWMLTSPFDLGFHGGLRVLLLGQSSRKGFHLSAGTSVGTQIRFVKAVSVSALLPIGYQFDSLDVWVAPTFQAFPNQAGTLTSAGAEAGVGINAYDLPIYFAGSYNRISDFYGFSATIGVGYNPGL